MTPVASSDRLIVGVDFGTTFSGIAYSYSASPDGPNNIPVIQSWPGHNNCTSYKVPSELAYATAETISQQSSAASRSRGAAGASRPSRLSPSNDIFNFTNLNASLPRASTSVPSVGQVRWGFELQPDETRLRCLKLFLDPSQRIPSFVSQTDMHDQLRRSGKDVPTAISDYLTELFKHARKTLAERYGEFFINTTRLEFVLTVPAIWSDAAKEATKAAAKRAGIREEIRMISEPEAAAVYTLQAIQPNHLKEGDNFIVCDAGGGTVDLISYEIKQISPLRVEESVGGTGACCGATFLNIKFEEYVRSKLGENAFRALRERRPRAWLAAMDYFEDYVKRKFYPEDRTDFNIPFPGVEDNRAAGIEQGFLTMSSDAVGNLFRPIVAAIIKLVEQQMASLQSQAKRVSGIILVGGFGQSRCLYRCLQTRFAYVEPPPPYSNGSFDRREPDRRFEVMQPNHAWTAVVRGAVLRGLEGNELVLSRKARRHYGVLMRTEWKSGTHSKNECVWDKDEEKWMVDNRVEWYITKGQTCASKDSILFPFYNTFRQRTGMSQISTLVICDDDVPPEKYDPSDTGPIRRLCKLPVNLESVPDRFWKSKRNSKGQSFERLEYVLGMRVGSGGLRFDHRVDDVSYGEVTADFN